MEEEFIIYTRPDHLVYITSGGQAGWDIVDEEVVAFVMVNIRFTRGYYNINPIY